MTRGGKIAIGALGVYLSIPAAVYLGRRLRGTLDNGWAFFGRTTVPRAMPGDPPGAPSASMIRRPSIAEDLIGPNGQSVRLTLTRWVAYPLAIFAFSK